jgi:hypothetical protein
LSSGITNALNQCLEEEKKKSSIKKFLKLEKHIKKKTQNKIN